MSDENKDYLTNRFGHLVPADKVRPENKLEDQTVNTLHARALKLRDVIAAFRAEAFADVDSFMDILAQQYKVKKGGRRGGTTLESFDGLRKVSISVSDFLSFGPELKIAKELIDACLKDWSDGANSNLRVFVEQAFRVDKNNRLNTQAILSLRSYDIQDEKWRRAMQAITDSVRVACSRSYIRFHFRANADARWEQISLDIAGV